jgi:hypothetical protein
MIACSSRSRTPHSVPSELCEVAEVASKLACGELTPGSSVYWDGLRRARGPLHSHSPTCSSAATRSAAAQLALDSHPAAAPLALSCHSAAAPLPLH